MRDRDGQSEERDRVDIPKYFVPSALQRGMNEKLGERRMGGGKKYM